MSEIMMDLDGLRSVERDLRASTRALEEAGHGAPAGEDYGAAGLVVATAMAAHVEAAAMVATECAVLGTAVGLCHREMRVTDAAQALALVTVEAE